MFDLKDVAPSVRAYINGSGLPMKSIGMEFSDLRPYKGGAIDEVKLWVENVKAGKVIKARGEASCGLGLLLVGKPGHGKTTLASTALQEVLKGASKEVLGYTGKTLTRPGYFTDYPRLLRLQKRQWGEEASDSDQWLIDGIHGDAPDHHNVKLLILDDLGKEYRTAAGWAENNFDAVLRSRFNNGLPTIITTNVPLSNWGDVYGEPMESFAHEAFHYINVVSEEGDRRKSE